jgi:hypothetical protein
MVEPGGFDVYLGDSSVGGLHGQFSVQGGGSSRAPRPRRHRAARSVSR